MNAVSGNFEKPFLRNWILATCGALILSLPVIVIAPQIIPLPAGTDSLGWTATIGAMVGSAQWLMLKNRIPLSLWWVLACAIGLGLPLAAESVARSVGMALPIPATTGGKVLYWTSLGFFGGLFSGMLQLPLLKTHYVKANWWIAASAAGWALCSMAASSVDAAVTFVSSSTVGGSSILVALLTGITALAGGLLFAVPLGALTGLSLLWMAKGSANKQQRVLSPDSSIKQPDHGSLKV